MRIESIQKHSANVPDMWKWKSWGMSLYIHYFPQHPGMVYFPTLTIIYHTNQPNVGKYSRYVDGMDLSVHDVTLLSKKDRDFKTASWWNRQNKTHSKRFISSPSPSPASPGRILWTAGIFPKEFSILPVRPFFKEKKLHLLRVRHLTCRLAPPRHADLRSCLSFESPGRWRTWSLRVGKESEFGSSRTKTEGKRCYKSLAEWEDASRVTHLFWKFWKLPSRKLTYPTSGKGTSSSKVSLVGDMLVSWRVVIVFEGGENWKRAWLMIWQLVDVGWILFAGSWKFMFHIQEEACINSLMQTRRRTFSLKLLQFWQNSGNVSRFGGEQ